MDAALESLLGTLLHEGYALYPYTGSAAKNSTPTPFGIVYPPRYAERTPGAFDRLRLHAVAEAGSRARIDAEVRFLQAAPGGGHRASERRCALPALALAELVAEAHVETFALEGLSGRIRLSASPLGSGLWRVALCVHNLTPLPAGAVDRARALARSLLSTHPILRLVGGIFISPLERDGPAGGAVAGCASVNTFPVLVSERDDVLLGSTIVLPDHPQLAPESRGELFDATEIEEALLLHLMALSDAERAEIAGGDPAIEAMVARAAAATPDELLRLHGRMVLSDPQPTEGLR